MIWGTNLFDNLLVVFIMGSLIAIVYCKITRRTLLELFKEIKEILSPEEYE